MRSDVEARPGRGSKSEDRRAKTKEVRGRLCGRLRAALAASPWANDKKGLARRLGVDPSSLSVWTAGRAWPGVDVLEDLADALGVTVGWFWTSEPVPDWASAVRPKLITPQEEER